MAEPSTGDRIVVRPLGFHSLASKFSVLTAALVLGIVVTMLAFDVRLEALNAGKYLLLLGIVILPTAAIWWLTSRWLVHPLSRLEADITSARKGRLEPIEVNKTGDEIELLGENLNTIIVALATSEHALLEQQKSRDQKIHDRTDQLEQAMRTARAARGNLLASLSQELHAPLNGVVGMLDMTLDRPLSPEITEQLRTARRGACSLLSLLNHIQDLSKIEAGKMTLEKTPFDPRVLLADCIKAHQPMAAENSVALRAEVAPNLPQQITGDPLRIRQIISNLLIDAMKFAEPGSIDVQVAGEFIQIGRFMVQINVRSTGTGIAADKLLSSFDGSTETNDSGASKFNGTAVGLDVTRRLAELHGGALRVESELGRGTIFAVTLQCDVNETTGAPQVQNPEATVALTAGTSGSAARILVVEDNHVNQKVVTAVLRKRGFSIELANDGQEALDKLESGAFDLVLMDVQMPVLDGLEATRLIRRETRWNTLPIVAMTAHAMNGDKERCLEAGMNGYISKPVHPALLLSTVDEFLLQKTT